MARYVANPVIVDAFPITAVVVSKPLFGSWYKQDKVYTVTLVVDGAEKSYTLNPGLTARMAPKVGDYYVIQEDGYPYINPKHVFERKYHAQEN
jgi:hypothetical protein